MATTNSNYDDVRLRRAVAGLGASPIEETALGTILTPDQINELTRRQELNVQPLIDFLRSDTEISTVIRTWLADLLEGKRNVKLELLPNTQSRPHYTRIKQTMLRRHAARFAIAKREEYGDKQSKRGVEEAAEIYPIDPKSIRKEMKVIEKIQEFSSKIKDRK
jgi:hypothetical protein